MDSPNKQKHYSIKFFLNQERELWINGNSNVVSALTVAVARGLHFETDFDGTKYLISAKKLAEYVIQIEEIK